MVFIPVIVFCRPERTVSVSICCKSKPLILLSLVTSLSASISPNLFVPVMVWLFCLNNNSSSETLTEFMVDGIQIIGNGDFIEFNWRQYCVITCQSDCILLNF